MCPCIFTQYSNTNNCCCSSSAAGACRRAQLHLTKHSLLTGPYAGSRAVYGADKPHTVPVLKTMSCENLCEIYGLAVFTEKPHFCWMTNAAEGLQWCSKVLKWGRSWGSSAWDTSQGQLLREQVDTARVLGIIVWKSKEFSGWLQWEKEKILS